MYYDIIIVGAGPAGLAASLYARRSGKTVLLLEKESFGGQMALAPLIENYPGFNKISGEALAGSMVDQVMAMGVEFELEKVINITKDETSKVKNFTIQTDYNTYQAGAVIWAAGAFHKMINVEKEKDLIGNGVSYCAVCDGAFYKGEEVAVIGDGNTALQYALELSENSPKVYICIMFDEFMGDAVLREKVRNNPKIEIVPNVLLQAFLGSEKLEGLVFENQKTKTKITINVKGVFIAIGQIPQNDAIKNLAQLDKDGYAIASEDLITKTEGLFVAGDCRTKKVRQVATAINDGAIAALEACNYLNNRED